MIDLVKIELKFHLKEDTLQEVAFIQVVAH